MEKITENSAKSAMTQVIETELLDTEKITRIYTPFNISEETMISGFAFSKRMMAQNKDLKRDEIARAFFEGAKAFPFADLVQKMISDSDGGPTIGENSLKIWVDATHPNAGSSADYIWLYFGRNIRVKCNVSGGSFPAGSSISWNLNDISDWLEDNVKTDLWDEIALKTDSNDGIKIDRIQIKHSSQTILDWNCNLWLDGSREEEYGRLVLTGKILQTKLNQIDNLWVPQIHWAAREIGKSDGSKYESTGEWCSEFASWCLRKAMWDTPTGNIGSQSMEDYFDDLNRMYTHDQLIDDEYRLVAGDYIRFEWASGGHHSGIFVEYIDDPATPSDATTIRTIEGNASSTVKVAVRNFQDILSVGNCQ